MTSGVFYDFRKLLPTSFRYDLREHPPQPCRDRGPMGQTRPKCRRRPGLPMVPGAGRAAAANVLQRHLRTRVENPQQPVVRPAAHQETRPGRLSALRLQRHPGPSAMDALETPSLGPRRAAALAVDPATLGGRSHRAGRRRRRGVRPRQLPAALPCMPRLGHDPMARGTPDRGNWGIPRSLILPVSFVVRRPTSGGAGRAWGLGPGAWDRRRTTNVSAGRRTSVPDAGRRASAPDGLGAWGLA